MAEKINTVSIKSNITEIVRVKQIVMERPLEYKGGITSTEIAFVKFTVSSIIPNNTDGREV